MAIYKSIEPDLPVGTIVHAEEVDGFETKYAGHRKLIWHACVECGLRRWVLLRKTEPQSLRCFPCGRKLCGKISKERSLKGEQSASWKGGRLITSAGYVSVFISDKDPLYSMADHHGRVPEHRLVMARHLNRVLEPYETVHHINGKKQDNRLANLEILTRAEHARRHGHEALGMRARVRDLEDEIRRLQNWTTLAALQPGAIFETEDGVRAVKSAWPYSGEPDSQYLCVLLDSGKYGHFPQRNATKVRVLG